MSAHIIAGFPGIGKSFVARNSALSVRDSDSSAFSWRGTERHPDFPHNYIRHIQDHLNDCDVILVSSHAEVRNALREAGLAYTLVYPESSQRDDYIERYIRRRSPASFIQLVHDRFDPWLAECRAETHPTHVVLARGQYLHDVLGGIVSSTSNNPTAYT